MTTNEGLATAVKYGLQRQYMELIKRDYTPEEALSELDIL